MLFSNNFELYGLLYGSRNDEDLVCDNNKIVIELTKMFRFNNSWSVYDVSYVKENIVKFSINSTISFVGDNYYYLSETGICPGILIESLSIRSPEYYTGETTKALVSLIPLWVILSIPGLLILLCLFVYLFIFLQYLCKNLCNKETKETKETSDTDSSISTV